MGPDWLDPLMNHYSKHQTYQAKPSVSICEHWVFFGRLTEKTFHAEVWRKQQQQRSSIREIASNPALSTTITLRLREKRLKHALQAHFLSAQETGSGL
ncbi:hypothetical protein Baya_16394 [Bagarius yarrelli]|uniref:Uncharacterized protein n=1 Tax=Bagarius yarrelli TaxID=175774 RepID=A0A556VV80_BAGYA|nr:hypothetical protein Baya_16394 [Bagarius yarrelli]